MMFIKYKYVLSMVFGILLFGSTITGCDNERRYSVTSEDALGTDRPVTKSSPMWAKMAAIHSGSTRPPTITLKRFQKAFDILETHCPDKPSRIGDFLVAGQRKLSRSGNHTSLLELTEAVSTMLDSGARGGGIPEMRTGAEPVALMVTMLLAQ